MALQVGRGTALLAHGQVPQRWGLARLPHWGLLLWCEASAFSCLGPLSLAGRVVIVSSGPLPCIFFLPSDLLKDLFLKR